jgi:hypothetical protein
MLETYVILFDRFVRLSYLLQNRAHKIMRGIAFLDLC